MDGSVRLLREGSRVRVQLEKKTFLLYYRFSDDCILFGRTNTRIHRNLAWFKTFKEHNDSRNLHATENSWSHDLSRKCVSEAGFEPPSSRLQIPRLTPRPHFLVVVYAPILSVKQGKFDWYVLHECMREGSPSFRIVYGIRSYGTKRAYVVIWYWCLACVLWFDICVYRSNVVMAWRGAYGYVWSRKMGRREVIPPWGAAVKY